MKLLEVERRFLVGEVSYRDLGLCKIRTRSLPRAHGKANGGADITTAADVQVAR